eukprot:gene25628-31336_t
MVPMATNILTELLTYLKTSISMCGVQNGNTALHWASLGDHMTCVSLLLRAEANAAIKNKDESTAHDLAISKHNSACAQMLALSVDEASSSGLRDQYDATLSKVEDLFADLGLPTISSQQTALTVVTPDPASKDSSAAFTVSSPAGVDMEEFEDPSDQPDMERD